MNVSAPAAERGRFGTWPFDRQQTWLLLAAIAAGIVVRLILLPTQGMRGDIDTFTQWVRSIALNGLPNAYDEKLSFPPVMAYIWGLQAAIEPAFRDAVDASSDGIRVIMKLPPTLADFGLAALVGYALRATPRWALLGAAAVLLYPGIVYTSAWWGQYESIYVLFALAAAVLAIDGRNGWAAGILALSLMTKPQALPMLLPFAAWFLATGGRREFVRCTVIGAAVIVVVWLPFLAADGPVNYVRNVAAYQGERFAVLSIWAWNIWWLVEVLAAGGEFVTDSGPIVGPLTLRHVGFLITGVLEVVVAFAVLRDPRPRTLILALAASVLIAFSFLTAMHERYSYAAALFLLLLIPDVRFRWINVAFAIVFTANLFVAVPPTIDSRTLIREFPALGVLGSIVMLAITAILYALLTRREIRDRDV